MKTIAILVIASTAKPLYVHYIHTYWAELIRHTNAHHRHIDVFLLFEHDSDLSGLSYLEDNIIVDQNSDPDSLCEPEFQSSTLPGILSKTIYAFELLQDRYDVFFRTNLSSVIRVSWFDQFVQNKSQLRYSGDGVWTWTDALRADLIATGKVGPDKSIKSLAELDKYEGNTFISGSNYFLSAEEVKSLVRRKDRIRYDIIDDVSIGLMFSEHEALPGFSITAKPDTSVSEIKHKIRTSNASHVRLQHFPLDKAQALWREIAHGQLWRVSKGNKASGSRYKICFPLFDPIESRSKEMRLTHEGLTAHPRVTLVDEPAAADYLVLCQEHLAGNSPLHARLGPIKDQYKQKTILLDYDDRPNHVLDEDDFGWKLYFKRSCVDRQTLQAVNFGNLPVLATAYCVPNDMVEPPESIAGRQDKTRKIAISCLFEDEVQASDTFERARGRLLTLAKRLDAEHDFAMQIGMVSDPGPVGRSGIDKRYKECLYDSKIILHANPDACEGDARTWEAVSSGALVFLDRMVQPIKNPLIDGEHVVFYDLTDEGMQELEQKILYYLCHDQERESIGMQGRKFALSHHRSINRIYEVIEELEDVVELEELLDLEHSRLRRLT